MRASEVKIERINNGYIVSFKDIESREDIKDYCEYLENSIDHAKLLLANGERQPGRLRDKYHEDRFGPRYGPLPEELVSKMNIGNATEESEKSHE